MKARQSTIPKQIPNILTMIRLPLLIAGLVLLHYQYVISAVLITIWFLSDIFDGWIARIINAQSKFGGYADHIVDGLSLSIAYTYILFQPVNIVIKAMLIIILVRILLVATKYYSLIRRKRKTRPSQLGKLASGGQMLSVVAFFTVPSLFLFVFIPSFILSLVSGIEYIKN